MKWQPPERFFAAPHTAILDRCGNGVSLPDMAWPPVRDRTTERRL